MSHLIKPGLQWQKILKRLGNIDKTSVYYDPSYIALYKKEGDEVEAFVHEDGDDFFFFPFLKKPIPHHPSVYDIQTVYGYGGPLASNNNPEFLKSCWTELQSTASNHGIIAGLMRFHPLLETHHYIDPDTVTLFQNFDVVCIDLSKPYDQIFATYSKDNRRRLRNAQETNIKVQTETSAGAWKTFHDIYEKRMDNLEAHESYFFDSAYFDGLREMGENQARLYLTYQNSTVIGGLIALLSAQYGSIHLTASDDHFLDLSPNNVLVDAAVQDIKAAGKSWLIYGGGRTPDPEDPLLKFKKHFSPVTKKQYLGSCVFHAEKYQEICQTWEAQNPDKIERYKNYCLKYRY